MPTLADAVTQIQAAGLPVLFADTCSLVDPIRTPLRPAELKDCIEAAQELLQPERPPACPGVEAAANRAVPTRASRTAARTRL